MKTYFDYMNEILPDELYEKLIKYGLFSEKLPPIFDNGEFLDYCKQKSHGFEKKKYRYVTYYSTRNINIPRAIGIPTPMAHEILCQTLKDYWSNIQNHFRQTTLGDKYRISRLHLKKKTGSESLFKMNYDNKSDSPVLDISLGKRYRVKTDISKCFPSIYTHSIPWALVTKPVAKSNMSEGLWYNKIDKNLRMTTDNETHGILIGPHTSNLVSEIVLCAVDHNISKKWKNYVRFIDDYECYVDSEDEAKQFLLDLNDELRNYGLMLNQGKTVIEKMPSIDIGNDGWISKMHSIIALFNKKDGDIYSYNDVHPFIDDCVELFKTNGENAAIIVYGFKCFSGKRFSYNAKQCILKISSSLAMLYPYLVSSIDDFAFIPLSVSGIEIGEYIKQFYTRYIEEKNYDAASFAIQLALKYGVTLDRFNVDEVINKNDCILLLCSFIYCRRHNLSELLKALEKHAKQLRLQGDMEEYWPFIYECLRSGSLDKDWKDLKNHGVSFLKSEYRI